MFSKKPAPGMDLPTRSAGQTNPMASPTFSVLGADLAIKGDISASSELHIDGQVDGDITCASLVQGEGSAIHGAIRAQTARLAGRVCGGIEVKQLIVLKTAKIRGDIKYESLTIEQGAHIDGHLSHGLDPVDPETTLILVS